MEIADNAAQVIVTGVTAFMLSLAITIFTALFSLLISVIADWIMGSV